MVCVWIVHSILGVYLNKKHLKICRWVFDSNCFSAWQKHMWHYISLFPEAYLITYLSHSSKVLLSDEGKASDWGKLLHLGICWQMTCEFLSIPVYRWESALILWPQCTCLVLIWPLRILSEEDAHNNFIYWKNL